MSRDNINLNFSGEKTFLNFWNYYNGDDVVCEVIGDKLMLSQYDDDGNELPPKEITIGEFCGMVKTRFDEIHKKTN